MLGKSDVFPLDLIWITHSSDNPQWRKERDIVASVSVISLWSPAAESLLLSTWMRSTSNKFAFYVSLRNCLPSTHISTRVPAVQYPWKPYIPLIMHLNPWSVSRFCSRQSFHIGGVVTEPSRMTPFTFPAAGKWQSFSIAHVFLCSGQIRVHASVCAFFFSLCGCL